MLCSALTEAETRRIEQRVNAAVEASAGGVVTTEQMPLPAAQQIGAIAHFGERYSDHDSVRVVQMEGARRSVEARLAHTAPYHRGMSTTATNPSVCCTEGRRW